MLDEKDYRFRVHNIHHIDEIKIISESINSLCPDIYVNTSLVMPFTGAFRAADSMLVSMVISGHACGNWKIKESYSELFALPGTIIIIPPNVPFELDIFTKSEFINIYISPKMLLDISDDFSFSRNSILKLDYDLFITDQFLEQIIYSIKDNADKGAPFSNVETEYLVRLLLARVISRYSASSCNEIVDGGLTPNTLQKVLDFIDKNLHRRIGAERLASMAGTGPAQFARLFKRAMKVTLHQYIIYRRIERAREMLATTEMPIAEIAQECGFSDQVHLTRFFGRLVGLSPASYRRKTRN